MSKTILKSIAIASALTFGAVTFASTADAGGRHHRHHKHKRHHGGNAAAAAILGFGVAAALASRPSYGYSYGYAPPYAYAPPPPPPPQPYYGPTYYSSGNYAPPTWSPAWYQYCAAKWRSFDPRSGTYQPNYGPRRLCH